jgi:hypothetical protein
MLLNKIPCLDKGFVAYVNSANNSKQLVELALEFFRTTDTANLRHMANLTLVIKCPLFVQLNLSKFDLSMVASPLYAEPEAYVPNAGEIGGQDRATNELIADDIGRTSEALLINPKAYQSDGCDRFVSQILSPVSTYTTLIVHGTHAEFRKFVTQPGMPSPIKSYADAVQQIIDMEWR